MAEAVRAASGVGWGLKAIGAALAIAAGAAGVYGVFSSDAPGREDGRASTVAAPAPAPAARSESASDREPMAVADGITEIPSEPMPPTAERASPLPSVEAQATPAVRVQRGSSARTADRNAAQSLPAEQALGERVVAGQSAAPLSAGPTGQLGEELSFLSKIRGSVQEGAPARALELISDYRARFERPILGMEADALRVDALCRTGERESAQASARAFLNDWPGSPLEQRVSSACP